MIENIIAQLKEKVGPDLIGKVGLDQGQVDKVLGAAGGSVKDLVGGKGVDMGSVLNLFSKTANNPGANDLLGRLGQDLVGKLTGQVGLDASKAGNIKDMIMPVLTDLLSEKVGGNAANLKGLLGGEGLAGMADQAKSKLGGLGKLFS